MQEGKKSSWNNKFIVIYQKSGKTKTFKYSEVSDEERRRLRSYFMSNSITIKCCCKSEIEQGVSSVFRIYNRSQKEKHARNCCKYHHYSNSSVYEQGWKEEEDGSFTIRLQKEGHEKPPSTNPTDPSTAIISTTSANLQEKEEKKNASNDGAKTKGQVTLLGLAAKLNMMAWERKAEQRNLPTNVFEILHQVYGLLKKVHLRKGDASLQTAFITNNKQDNPAKRGFFFYLLFNKASEKATKLDKPAYYVSGSYKLGSKKEYYTFSVNQSIFQQAQKWNKSDYIICGFANPIGQRKQNDENHTLFTCNEMVAFPVTQQGLFYQSSYEKRAYEYFVKQKRIFFKPYRNMIEYDDRCPDVIFIDRDPLIIGEIFGMKTLEYENNRKEKLAWSQNNSNAYGFWYWDASEGDSSLYIEQNTLG